MSNKSFLSIYHEYENAVSLRKQAQENENLLKDKLKSLIPENAEKGGIIRRTTYGKSISYAKALPEIKSLIPKTRHPDADRIIEEYTTTFPRDSFKAV